MSAMKKRIYLVLPCYNEEDVLESSANQLFKLMKDLIQSDKIDKDSRIYFINDGSHDKTWDVIERLHDGFTI